MGKPELSVNPRILIVDDEENICHVLKKVLKNYSTASCNSANEALEILKKNTFEIVITDINMPEVDGIRFARNLRYLYPEIEILIVTGMEVIRYLGSALDLGVVDMIPKPFSNPRIVEAVEKAWKRYLRKLDTQSNNEILIYSKYLDKKTIEAPLDKHEFQFNKLDNAKEVLSYFEDNSVDILILDYDCLKIFPDLFKISSEFVSIAILNNEQYFDLNCHIEAYKKGCQYVIDRECDQYILNSMILNCLQTIKMRKSLSRRNYDLKIHVNAANSKAKFLEKENKEITVRVSDLEELVNRRTQELVHAEKLSSLGILSAGVAHEINNPNTFLRGNNELIQKYWGQLEDVVHAGLESMASQLEQKKLDRMRKMVNKIPEMINDSLDGSDRISQIVNSLNSFSKMEDDKKSEVDISKLIEQAILLTQNKLKYHCLVENEIEENIPKVLASKNRLIQVLVNLLTNSSDAISEKIGMKRREEKDEDWLGSIKIKVYSKKVNQKKKSIIIEFHDDGVGIKKEELSNIFDNIYTTKPMGRGTGLGLMIIKNAINDHQGNIEVKSEYGEGTAFIIELPIV